MAIRKAVRGPHLREKRRAAALAGALDAADRAALERSFPPPRRKPPLAVT